MSLALALVSRTAAVVASDSIRVDGDGTLRRGYDKTFKFGGSLIGTHVGLLHFNGKPATDHIAAALGGRTRLSAMVLNELMSYIAQQLQQEPIVSFENRRLELLLVGKAHSPTIQALEFFPDPTNKIILHKLQAYNPWGITGNDAARAPICQELENMSLERASLEHLQVLARSLMTKGITACGPHPYWSDLPSCSEPVCIQSGRASVA